MLKKKRRYFIGAILLILLAVVVYTKNYDFDTVDYMEKSIARTIGTHDDISTYTMIHQNDHRLVSYLQAYDHVGYALFKVDDQGHYKLLELIEPDVLTEYKINIDIYEFNKLTLDGEIQNPEMFILSNNPDLKKIELIKENGDVEVKPVTIYPSVINYTIRNDESICDIKFYDQDDQELE